MYKIMLLQILEQELLIAKSKENMAEQEYELAKTTATYGYSQKKNEYHKAQGYTNGIYQCINIVQSEL